MLILGTWCFLQAEATNFEECFRPFYNKEKNLRIITRSFDLDSLKYYVVANPFRLTSQVVAKDSLRVYKYAPVSVTMKSPLLVGMKLMKKGKAVYPVTGLTHGQKKEYPGVFLTIDICPTSKEINKIFFSELESLRFRDQKPIEIAVSLSGRWLEKHLEDFQWLLEKQRNKVFNITWINHSYSHPYLINVPADSNFFNLKDTDWQEDSFKMEAEFIKYNIPPPIYYRFPGLVSSKKLMKKVEKFNLLPIGTDAWIGKEQIPMPGSIVLVHGNGNEIWGTKGFVRLLAEHPEWELLPLRETISEH